MGDTYILNFYVLGIRDNMDCSLPKYSGSGEDFDPKRNIFGGSDDFGRSV